MALLNRQAMIGPGMINSHACGLDDRESALPLRCGSKNLQRTMGKGACRPFPPPAHNWVSGWHTCKEQHSGKKVKEAHLELSTWQGRQIHLHGNLALQDRQVHVVAVNVVPPSQREEVKKLTLVNLKKSHCTVFAVTRMQWVVSAHISNSFCMGLILPPQRELQLSHSAHGSFSGRISLRSCMALPGTGCCGSLHIYTPSCSPSHFIIKGSARDRQL